MTCSYCGTRNGQDEHRCRRCGRRPGDVLNVGALATKLQPMPESDPAEAAVAYAPAKPANLSRAVQRSLFPDKSDNVIPIASYGQTTARPKPKTAAPARTKPAARRSRISDNQASLDFLPSLPPAPRQLGTTVNAVIVCEAPVATPLHRAVAAAIDWSLVLIGYGLFLFAYFVCGGEFVTSKLGYIVLGSALPLVGLTYGLLCACAGAETPGMNCAQLKLTTFDGFKPDGKQRLYRFLGSCVSLCTVLGLAWSLVDEESLGWQDHISRTFPTPREVDTLTFRRR